MSQSGNVLSHMVSHLKGDGNFRSWPSQAERDSLVNREDAKLATI